MLLLRIKTNYSIIILTTPPYLTKASILHHNAFQSYQCQSFYNINVKKLTPPGDR